MSDIDNRWSNKSGYIAYTTEVAVKSIAETATILNKELGVDALNIPQFRDPAYDMALKLESIAKFLEQVTFTLYPSYAKAKEAAAKAAEKAAAQSVKIADEHQALRAELETMGIDELLEYASALRIGFPPNTLPDVIRAEIVAVKQREAAAKLQAEPVQPEAVGNEETDDSEHNSVYSGMTKKELKIEADNRGVNIDGLRSNAEIIDALEAADGLTENEQAAEDGK